MSVLDNITFAPIEHKLMTKEEAEELGMELLEKVGLADKANANPDSLSGGQKTTCGHRSWPSNESRHHALR